MKNICLFFLCAILASSCHSQVSHTSQTSSGAAKINLTAADWQADLRFLQQTVHKDYSFLFKNITAEQFDAEVDKLYKAMPSMQEHERFAGMGRIVAFLNMDIQISAGEKRL